MRRRRLRRTTGSVLLASVLLTWVLLPGPARAAQLEPEWTCSFDGPGTKDDVPRAIALSPDGRTVVVTGESATPLARTNAITIACDADTGAIVWTAVENDGPDDGMFDVAFSPDGDAVYVTGKDGRNSGPSDDALVVAYDASTGARRWKTALEPPDDRVQTTMLAVSPSGGRVVVAGRTWDAPIRTYVAGLAAADGAPEWETFEGDAAAEGFRPLPVDLGFDPAGNAITAATSLSRSGVGGDVHVVSYRGPSGVRRWGTTYDGPAAGPDLAAGLAIAPDGSTVYVAGSADVEGRASDVLALAVATADGAIVWDTVWDGAASGFDDGAAVAVAPGGRRIVVAGTTQRPAAGSGDPHEDLVVIAVRRTVGAVGWDATYDGPGHGFDGARDVAVGADRSIVVTGTSLGLGDDADVVTLCLAPDGIRRWFDRAGDPLGDDGAVGVVAGAADAYTTSSFARPAPLGEDIVTMAYRSAG